MNITLSPFPENVRNAIEALIDSPAPNQEAPDLSVRYSKHTPTERRTGAGEFLHVNLEYLDYRAVLTAEFENDKGEKTWRLSMGYKTIASTNQNADMSAGDIISEVNRLLDILHRDSQTRKDASQLQAGR